MSFKDLSSTRTALAKYKSYDSSKGAPVADPQAAQPDPTAADVASTLKSK